MSNPRQNKFRQGYTSVSPIPHQVVSNEEFLPTAQTPQQSRVEWLIHRMSGSLSNSLGIDRREFLKTTGGMALGLLAMNQVFGKFFDVLPIEAAEPQAFHERRGTSPFIFDVQTHYVSSSYNGKWKDALLELRRRAREMGVNPKLSGDTATLKDLSWENFIREVFLDSDTDLGVDQHTAGSLSMGGGRSPKGNDPYP